MTKTDWLLTLRAGLVVFLVYAIRPDWPIWRTMIVAILISAILTITGILLVEKP